MLESPKAQIVEYDKGVVKSVKGVVDFREAVLGPAHVREEIRSLLIEEAGIDDPRIARITEEIQFEVMKAGMLDKFIGEEVNEQTIQGMREQTAQVLEECLRKASDR